MFQLYLADFSLVSAAVGAQIPEGGEDGLESGLFLGLHGCFHKSPDGAHLPQSCLGGSVGPPAQVPQHTGCYLPEIEHQDK